MSSEWVFKGVGPSSSNLQVLEGVLLKLCIHLMWCTALAPDCYDMRLIPTCGEAYLFPSWIHRISEQGDCCCKASKNDKRENARHLTRESASELGDTSCGWQQQVKVVEYLVPSTLAHIDTQSVLLFAPMRAVLIFDGKEKKNNFGRDLNRCCWSDILFVCFFFLLEVMPSTF